jgi:glycerophosphoryl diester phosphodiesterase
VRGLLIGFLVTGGLVAIGAALGPRAPAAAADPRPPLVAAHRGGALLWPENSLLAFRNAVALGVDYLECDAHLSRDGVAVVIHDPTLDRTTSGAGPVRARALAELLALRLKAGDGSATDERIPTLEEVVALAASGRRQLLLEIKVGPDRARYPDIEEKVLAVLDRHGMAPATVVMAFEPPTWRRLRALRPDVRAGALYSRRSLERLGSTLPAELEAARAAGVAFVGLEQRLVTADVVETVAGAGMLLGVWTVNEAPAIRRFVELGVGLVISDRPDLVKAAVGR